MAFFDIFRGIGRFFAAAWSWAKAHGLSDALIQEALKYVRQAEEAFIDNQQKREWVIAILVGRGIPESIARLAVELAVQLLHKELDKIGA